MLMNPEQRWYPPLRKWFMTERTIIPNSFEGEKNKEILHAAK